METSHMQSADPVLPAARANMICPKCHQPVVPEYYFCPNCGNDLHQKPLSTSFGAQFWLYFFSVIIMPVTCCLAYRYWKGWKYLRSKDPKARRVGLIATILLVVSLAVAIWLTFALTAWLAQYEQNQTNSDLNSLGL